MKTFWLIIGMIGTGVFLTTMVAAIRFGVWGAVYLVTRDKGDADLADAISVAAMIMAGLAFLAESLQNRD